jgi:hypothetical protein
MKMGFRSAFVSEQLPVKWPEWFVDKYSRIIHFTIDNQGCISSKKETKVYDDAINIDIQRAFIENNIKRKKEGLSALDKFILVYLHECGGITRVEITPYNIFYTEPLDYVKVDFITHDYCYGCSDYKVSVSRDRSSICSENCGQSPPSESC